jgi:hypothetical protein
MEMILISLLAFAIGFFLGMLIMSEIVFWYIRDASKTHRGDVDK